MACWVGPGPGKPSHKGEKMFPIMTSTKEKPPPEINFFSIWTRRLADSVEGLNSSQAQSDGK